uniref:M-ectatotoxin-Eb2a n=1 Tax=Ectatomma brunneum TaxID=369127 RepID=LTX2A_ECTBR|nr:RecName: Full=M-ectatotoxin-Eb2a; Short=M-ECTX-Eb2a; AltName: Full=Ponericin-Q42 [Ectatomma brunneum]
FWGAVWKILSKVLPHIPGTVKWLQEKV